MAKKNISARVPPRVADSIDEYAEVWDMNRTDTITALLENAVEGLPEPEQMEGFGESDPLRYAYTLELDSEAGEKLEETMEANDETAGDVFGRLVTVYF